MKKKVEFSPIIKELQVLAFYLKPNTRKPNEKIEYNINVSSNTRVSPEKKYLIVISDLEITDKEDGSHLCSIKASSTYEVNNFSEVAVKREDGRYTVDIDVEKELTVASFNTLR